MKKVPSGLLQDETDLSQVQRNTFHKKIYEENHDENINLIISSTESEFDCIREFFSWQTNKM